MKATVIDLENKVITIDLEKIEDAIENVDFYRNTKHVNRGFEVLDEKLNTYWNDLYNKLVNLKKQYNGTIN